MTIENARKGTGTLTRADFEAWKSGKVRLTELGARCGVSQQAVSKVFRKFRGDGRNPSEPQAHRKAETVAQAPSMDAPAAEPPASGLSEETELPTFTSEDAERLAKSAAFAILVEAHKSLMPPTGLGPSALKAAMAAVENATGMLAKLGVISFASPEQDKIPNLVVQVYSAEEEAEIRRKVEEAAAES